MKRIDLTVPGITNVKIVLARWLFADGDQVEADSTVCELDVEGPFGNLLAESVIEHPAPVSGRLRQIIPAGINVEMGQLIGWIDSK